MVLEQFIVYLNTVFLGNYLIFFFLTSSLIGYLSLNKIYFLENNNHLNFLIIKSIILLSYSYIVFALLSFVTPITNIISSLYYIIGLLFFFYFFLKKELVLKLRWLVIIPAIITIYTYKSGVNNDFIYHFEHINLFKNLSINNFHGNIIDYRIKYNSAFILLNSFTYIEFLKISVKFLPAFLLTLFIIDMRKILLEEKFNSKYIKLAALFFLISVLITLSKFKNIGTDYVAHIFYLTLIIFYLSALKLKINFFNSKKFFIILAISLAIMTILKISMILSSLILLHYLYIIYKNKNVKIFFSIYLIIPTLMITLWASHNLILSNCIIYPISKLCFVSDKEISSIIFENIMISLYAKDVILNYWNTPLSDLVAMNSFLYWIKIWIVNGFYEVLEKFIPILIIFYLSIFDYFKKYKDEKVINLFNSHLLFYILSLLSIVCWLIQAPSFRFGFSYIVIFLFLTNIYLLGVVKFPYYIKSQSKNFINIFNLYFMLFLFYQFYRIYTV